MGFAIIAQFPLGVYRGHHPDGRTERLPSPARLHAALLAAAGRGLRAELVGGGLEPRESDRAALVWLEAHPPDAIATPPHITEPDAAVAYRAEGFFGVRKGNRVLKTRTDRLGGTALGGGFAWVWDEQPPEDVMTVLDALCRDVSHLGTADSPVVLRPGDATPTHRADLTASPFSRQGLEFEIPDAGRTKYLEHVHRQQVASLPTVKVDRVGMNEHAAGSFADRSATTLARYVPQEQPSPAAPWSTVVMLPIDEPVPVASRVAWSVALHRALVSLIGDGAPSLVTGRYDAGIRRPANRLAIQYVSASVAAAPRMPAAGAFALLVPGDADAADLAVVDRALRSLSELRTAGRRIRFGHPRQVEDGTAFWGSAPAGHVRVWTTAVPAIPESRPPRGQPWTIGHAALMSLALVVRDRFDMPARRAEWYAALVSGVLNEGAAVLDAHKIHVPRVHRFVHRVSPEMAIQPYHAVLRTGRVVSDRTIMAIGQTRHLGGGLLVPLDLPTPTATTEGHPDAR